MSKIPDQKHSDKELSRLRAQSAMQANNSSIVETYTKKLASKPIIILGYALPLLAPFWCIVKSMTKDADYVMKDFYIMVVPIALALVIALWIALKRVLSRHNSAFILILSLLCCFPIISVVNSNKNLKYDLMSMIGKDVPQIDPLLDSDESEEEGRRGVMTEADREALKLALEEQERERADWLREKALREQEATKETMPVVPNP